MKRDKSTILENQMLADGIYKMTLETPECAFTAPGQFAMLEVPEKFLRRPISVSSYDSDRYVLIYKVVGDGTKKLSRMEPGEKISSLTGLGNGYDVDTFRRMHFDWGAVSEFRRCWDWPRAWSLPEKKCRVILGF